MLTNFDIFATAGGSYIATRQSLTAVADTNGDIAVGFENVSGYAQVNGIQVLSGTTPVLAINCGDTSSGNVLAIANNYNNNTAFENQGTLVASNGATLNVDGLTGNLGIATLEGAGSQLGLNGTYTVDQGLTASAGQTVSLGGNWTNASTIAANGGTLNLGNGNNAWNNTGTISATNSTVNLGGYFTLATLGAFTHPSSTVNLTGTLDNTGTTLTLDASTGSWNLLGGEILNGTLDETDGASLVMSTSGGTLDGVTVNGNLDLTRVNGVSLTIMNTLTLNGTMSIGAADGSTYGFVYFGSYEAASAMLAGNASVVFGGNGNNQIHNDCDANGAGGGTLTFASTVTIHGQSGTLQCGYGSTNTIINQGTISADGYVPAGAYSYDTGYSGGTNTSSTGSVDTSEISDPAPQSVYQLFRYGYDNSLGYTLSGLTPGASYTVNLDFATQYSEAGQQVFNVSLNGTQVLTNFDIYATAGGSYIATRQSLTAVADTNGDIAVGFENVSGYAQVNGIQVLSGTTPVLAINCGDTSGGNGLTIFNNNNSMFENQGTLDASNGETLSVGGLTGNLGIATLEGTGSQLVVNGTYTVDQGLTTGAGQTVSLGGNWTNASTITANGGTLNLGEGNSAWNNTGTISATNSTVNLGGYFMLAALGTFTHPSSTVNLTGTLDNTGTTLTLDASTGSWNLLGGEILNGTLDETDGASLVMTTSNGTLDGVTVNGNLDLTRVNGVSLTIMNTLTLNGTMSIGAADGSTYGFVYFGSYEAASAMLAGNASVVFGGSGNNLIQNDCDANGAGGGALTFASTVTIHGQAGYLQSPYGNTNTIINQGTISADGYVPAGAYSYDTGYSGGTNTSGLYNAVNTSEISDPAPEEVYQSFRYGYDNSLGYTLSGLTPGASYTVNLDFATTYSEAGTKCSMSA